MSRQITFVYRNSIFRLNPWSITHYTEYEYDQECDNSSGDCRHYYGHCQIITNIRYLKFNNLSFARHEVELVRGEADVRSEVIEIVGRALSDVSMESYLYASGISDYYGEVLKISVIELSDLESQIATNLKLEGLSDVTCHS